MFNTRQMATLQALVDAIIPEDDYPSGWQAGVGDYLLRQLQGDLAHCLPAYRDWLDALEGEAQAACQRAFASLDLAAQSALLAAIERGDIQTQWTIEQAGFFAEIVEHCTEGFYADPGNGGNRGGVAWAMVGFEVTA